MRFLIDVSPIVLVFSPLSGQGLVEKSYIPTISLYVGFWEEGVTKAPSFKSKLRQPAD